MSNDMMARIRGFEKVSPEGIAKFKEKLMAENDKGVFPYKYIVEAEDVTLPVRMTACSSGYDFYLDTKIPVVIPSGDTVIIVTGVKAYMGSREELKLYVRSSLGIKKCIMTANVVPKIDSDYYENSDNEGNIMIALHNYGKYDVILTPHDRIVQGSFYNYLVADNGNLNNVRTGGLGSTL